ncbi:T9SS type A sorting domain-containing protein, partial [Nonlabens xiamenensis]|uniref:T9SS type A sorting domain-containing protein n=1 Tax=Nonlabens xiamenensis TaxID=2341043 RepID=UPI000F606878
LDGSTTSIRQENGAPYEWNAPGQNDPALQTLSAGTHTLRAVAIDNEGATGEAQVTITVNAAPTNAATTLVHIVKRNTNFALDAGDDADDFQNIYLWAADPTNVNQQWVEIDRGDGYYSYQKVNTNYCMDGGDGGIDGQNVFLYPCDENNYNQHWLKVEGSSFNKLQKRNASGFRIDGGTGGANFQNVALGTAVASDVNQHLVINVISGPGLASKAIGVEDNLRNELTIFPNPASEEFTISLQGIKSGEISIYNINSQLILTRKYTGEPLTIDRSVSLKAGIYLIKAVGNDGTSIVEKFILK